MNRQISILAVLAIITLGGGIWISQLPSSEQAEASHLFTDLNHLANEVNSVEITNAQGVLFRAKKVGDGWLANFDPYQPAYPVSKDKLADFVESAMQAKLVEAKTSKVQNYARLGLQDITMNDSLASLVILKTKNKSWQMLIGNQTSVGQGSYVRLPKTPQSWRTDKTITLPVDKYSWLEQPILPYQFNDIRTVSRTDNATWQMTKQETDSDFELIDMPKDRGLKYDSILNSVVSSLTSLNFEALQSTDEYFVSTLEVLTELEVSTLKGIAFQVTVSKLGDKHFVNFNSNGSTDYWQQWHYQVSNFSAQQLIKTLDDFLAEEVSAENDTELNVKAVDEGESPN